MSNMQKDKKPLKMINLNDGKKMINDVKSQEIRICCKHCDGTGKAWDKIENLTDGTPDIIFEVNDKIDGVYKSTTTTCQESVERIHTTLKDVKEELQRQINFECADLTGENDEQILIKVMIKNSIILRHRQINRRQSNSVSDLNNFIDEKAHLIDDEILNNSMFDKVYRQDR